jgi:hypothetical protein
MKKSLNWELVGLIIFCALTIVVGIKESWGIGIEVFIESRVLTNMLLGAIGLIIHFTRDQTLE